MAAKKEFKLTALPSAPYEPNGIYYISNVITPDYVEMYVANSAGTSVKRALRVHDVNFLIDQKLLDYQQTLIVADIAARDAVSSPKNGQFVYVKNAAADATVASGAATYIYELATTTWVKVAEYESMDLSLDWSDITGKPTSTPAQIDTAVTNSHTHSNKTQLDKVGETGGLMTYDGDYVFGYSGTIGW
jgi:hypothetical protein